MYIEAHLTANPPQLSSLSSSFLGVSNPYLHAVDLPGGTVSLPCCKLAGMYANNTRSALPYPHDFILLIIQLRLL